jgi:hypothetical protein
LSIRHAASIRCGADTYLHLTISDEAMLQRGTALRAMARSRLNAPSPPFEIAAWRGILYFVHCQTRANLDLTPRRPDTRRTPYAFLSHIANAIDATYRVTDGTSNVCISNQYEI